jgi:hypothetical protein
MQQARKEERETVGALADLELKAQELGLTEKRYADLARIAEMQVAASAGKSTGGFTEADYINAVLDQINKIRSEIQNSGLSEEKVEAMAVSRVNRAINPNSTTSNRPILDYIPGKGYINTANEEP